MRELKKIAAIGGAIALVACWPLAVGKIAETVLKDGIASLNSQDIAAQVTHYQRGYLSASATTEYTINDPLLKQQFIQDGLPTVFVLQHEIKHGFLRIAAQSQLTNFDSLPLTLQTYTQLNGNTEFELDIDNINYSPSSDQSAGVSIAKSRVVGSATVLGEVDLTYSIPSIQLYFASGETVNITAVTGFSKGKKVNGFWHGEQQVTVGDSAFLSHQGEVVTSANAFNYTFRSLVDSIDNRLDTNHLIKIASLTANDQAISNVSLDVTLGDLDMSSFEGLVSLYQSNPTIDNATLTEAVPLIDQLFNQGFHLSMNEFTLATDTGRFESTWNLTVPLGTDHVSQDFSKIIPALTGQLDTFISNGLIKANPLLEEGVDELVIMDMVQSIDNGYQLKAEIVDGNLVFSSGQQIPLVSIFMMLIMSS